MPRFYVNDKVYNQYVYTHNTKILNINLNNYGNPKPFFDLEMLKKEHGLLYLNEHIAYNKKTSINFDFFEQVLNNRTDNITPGFVKIGKTFFILGTGLVYSPQNDSFGYSENITNNITLPNEELLLFITDDKELLIDTHVFSLECYKGLKKFVIELISQKHAFYKEIKIINNLKRNVEHVITTPSFETIDEIEEGSQNVLENAINDLFLEEILENESQPTSTTESDQLDF